MVGSSIDTKPCASPTLSLSLHPPASHIIQNAIGPLGKGPPTACFPVRGRHSYKLYSPMVVYLLILSENLKQKSNSAKENTWKLAELKMHLLLVREKSVWKLTQRRPKVLLWCRYYGLDAISISSLNLVVSFSFSSRRAVRCPLRHAALLALILFGLIMHILIWYGLILSLEIPSTFARCR